MLSSLSELSAENLNAANVQEIEEVRNDEGILINQLNSSNLLIKKKNFHSFLRNLYL